MQATEKVSRVKLPAYTIEDLCEVHRTVKQQNGTITQINVNHRKGQRYEVIVEFPKKEHSCYEEI
ncbi:hypothetical protein [Gracilibacillus thailandensis]|uniref:Uncharacterized protein n=1 Tax=Gracilibacillus thailandensis TaxID=563735 RepID=A0A6N7QTG7_9BACI|nr:hypothetical protein [Gracilibacillus thailandensis]MRI65353.1 hypothetical protein [Gracilibacillus thailandensis]